ncbi:polysaccharide deacetylase family protein [Patescibacteria group bacterium]|nr:polysaccharide deacetylase family protein [Patescibacteria group bacterium]
MKKFIITMDIEQDISSKLKDSYKGVEALPKFLDLLKNLNIKASFFTTADVCIKYPDTIKRIVREEHELGCHGLNHEMFWFKSYRKQYREIKKATEIIEKTVGIRPKMFRTPKFGVTGKTIQALERLGYNIDSSVMPNAVTRIFKGLYKVRSLVGAPKTPYYPSYKDVTKEGESKILEIPLTESPVEGVMIGSGSLNKFGIDKMVETINKVEQDYIMFLMHSWELVDLRKFYPDLKEWVLELCSDNLEDFEKLFSYVKINYEIATIGEITNTYK